MRMLSREFFSSATGNGSRSSRIKFQVLAGSAAAVTLAGLGLAGTAQAAVAGPHTAVRATLTIKPGTVPAGVNTAVSVSNPCATGTQPSSITGFPAPNGTTTDVQAGKAEAPKANKLYGVWPAPGKSSYTITLTCPNGTTATGTVKVVKAPAATSVVGVGSNTIQGVMDQFSGDYNSAKAGQYLYSWDATNPITGAIGDSITTKNNCTAIPRPDGSSAGITALTTENGTTGGHPCIDFGRSSRPRGASDPTNVTFITLAEDAVDYAVQSTTNAPANLTTADLTGIYNCTITNWKQIGGKNGTIAPFIPQPSSGTRSFFLAAIGVTTPGSCVSDDNGNLEENEGVNPVLNTNKANVIFPYSVGAYLAARYHSATCENSTCTPDSNGIICSPKGTQPLFQCNDRGTMILGELNGTDPTTPWPLTASTTGAKISTSFTPSFLRYLYDVVPGTSTIPSNLTQYFGPTGWMCTNATAKTDIANYGFLALPAGTAAGDCGSLS